MSLGGFTLADRLGAKTVPCRVSGCTRTWIQLSNAALKLGTGAADANDPTAGMCEPCRGKAKEVKDVQRGCDRPGCEGTWTWPAQAQLEAFATKKPAPKRLCAECETKLASLETKQLPCTVPGCTRSAVLSPRAQLLAEGAAPVEGSKAPTEGTNGSGPGTVTVTGVLCGPCEDVSHRIKDRQVSCGINGCKRKWIWRADDQMQAFAAGKPNEPPRRMCDECRAGFGKLVDRDVRCRTSGCKKTWVWSRYDQLDACVAGKAAPKAPSQMCESCFDVFQHVKDVERPCRRSTCKGTWTDKRGAQLARAVRGKTGDPYPRYCPSCDKELGDLQDREISCKTENCPGTWAWTREQQLAAGVRPKRMLEVEEAQEAGLAAAPVADAAPAAISEAASSNGEEATAAEPVHAVAGNGAPAAAQGSKKKRNKRRREPKPPERRCSACAEFLADRKTQEIACVQCTTPIYWPPESQLQTHLGNWAAPGLCGACKRDLTEAARKAEREALRSGGQLHVQGGAAQATSTVPEGAAPEPAPTVIVRKPAETV
jgi:hypothetical protein